MRRLVHVLAFVALAAMLLLAAACGEKTVTDSGVQGEVRIGPVNPVEQPGVQNDAPYAATLRIKRASDGKVVAETRSATDGSFRFVLPPDDYILEPVNGDPSPSPNPRISPSRPVGSPPSGWTTIRAYAERRARADASLA